MRKKIISLTIACITALSMSLTVMAAGTSPLDDSFESEACALQVLQASEDDDDLEGYDDVEDEETDEEDEDYWDDEDEDEDDDWDDEDWEETEITVTTPKLTILVNKKASISASVEPEQDLYYSSSNKKIAVVNKKGLVTGLKAGTCYITIESEDEEAVETVKVTVLKKAVKNKKLTLKKKKIKMEVGDTEEIEIKKITKNTTDKITYHSNKKKVASVNSYGIITAKKKGKTLITVKCGKKTAKLTVIVT